MENKKEMRTWLDDMGLDHPLVIAGPCSAETEEQVLRIAHSLKDTDVNYYRAGIWKPRTRPGNFEGVGALGLKWLQKVKAETGLKTATEVANRAHVELALEHDVDLLWIGARSTMLWLVHDKIVLVKNPVNPDLALWLGGIERLHTAGIKKLGAIHRGFSTYEKSKYRNIPEWQLAIEFQNKFPDLPLINDPSHITGKRDMIFDVSQTALDLNFDGLMIETHHDPDNAWSDAAQQFKSWNDLKIRKESDPEAEYNNQLGNLRAQIDIIDNSIIETLGKRMKVSDGIGALKKSKNVAVLQSNRWNEILGKMILEGETKGLSEEFVLRMFKGDSSRVN
ncbi:Phospho-2-dehydro-3-deoxyheptonate aldolase [Nymphon striatum]|nr:Phospho-2-dehydro-3-deoxyheptonate aldolase [Nymphon striatum]